MNPLNRLAIMIIFAWRNIWRYPKRSFILFLVMFLGLFSTLFFTSLMQAWGQSMLNQTFNNLGAEVLIEGQTANDEQSDIHTIFPVSNQQKHSLNELSYLYSSRIKLPAIIKSEYDMAPTVLMAVNLKDELFLSQIGRFYVHQQNLKSPDFSHFISPFHLEQPYQILVGEALLEQLNTQVGRRIVLMTESRQGELKEIGLTIVGSFSTGNDLSEKAQVYLPLSTVQNWLDLQDQVNQIALRQSPVSLTPQLSLEQQIETEIYSSLIQSLQQWFPDHSIQAWQTRQPFAYDSIKLMISFNWVWVLMIGVLMLFGLLNTLYMMLYERRKELVNLYTLGISQTKLRLLLLLELIFILLIAGILALFFMQLLVNLLSSGIDLGAFSEGSAWLGVERILYLKGDYPLWLQNGLELIIVLVFMAFIAIYRSTRISQLRPQHQS